MKFITLPNGNSIRADQITAVRIGDARAADGIYKAEMKPRVIVDFGGNCSILDCETNEERDELSMSIMAEIKAATA